MFWNITKLRVTPSSCFFNKYYNFCCWCISLSKKKNKKRPWRSICGRIPQDPSDSKKRIAEKKGALLTIMQMASWFKPWPLFPNTGGHQQPLKGSLNHPKKVTKNCQVICVFETGLQKPFIHSCNSMMKSLEETMTATPTSYRHDEISSFQPPSKPLTFHEILIAE